MTTWPTNSNGENNRVGDMTAPERAAVCRASNDRVMGRAPRVTDDDGDTITVSLAGKEIRSWSYFNQDERREKMKLAREFVEGWFQASEHLANPDPLTALKALVDRDAAYFNNEIRITCDSHADAIARMAKARAVVATIEAVDHPTA